MTTIATTYEDALKTVFFEALRDTTNDHMRVATKIDAGNDAPVPLGALEHDYKWRNRTWESSLAFDPADLNDLRVAKIKIRAMSLARELYRHLDEMAFTLLADGFDTKSHDGHCFFDAVHGNRGAAPLDAAAIQSAITAMMRFRDDQGQLLAVVPDLLVVPPDLQWTAMDVLESAYWPEDASGTKDRLDLLVSPYLADSKNWFLLCTKRLVRPVILQERTPVEFAAVERDDVTAPEWLNGQCIFAARARYNAGYGPWQMAYGSQVA